MLFYLLRFLVWILPYMVEFIHWIWVDKTVDIHVYLRWHKSSTWYSRENEIVLRIDYFNSTIHSPVNSLIQHCHIIVYSIVVVVVVAIGVRLVGFGATCGSPGHHGIWGPETGVGRSLLFCTMSAWSPCWLLSSPRGVHPFEFSGLFAPIRLDQVGPPHCDVDSGRSRWGVVIVVVARGYSWQVSPANPLSPPTGDGRAYWPTDAMEPLW